MSSLSRRGFIKGSTVLLGSIIIQNTVSESYFGLATARAASNVLRPLRMLVLGDSVMWGQGLAEENKFSYKLRNWLCQQRNGGGCPNKSDVEIHVEAHSGAIISDPDKDKEKKKEEERFTREVAPLRYSGEVNNAYPTVHGQIDLALRYYTANSIPRNEINLIIVNGGINDMNATKLLILRLLGNSDVRSSADDFCNGEMSKALLKIAKTFPNARIIVPGYFPLITEKTPRATVLTAIRELIKGDVTKVVSVDERAAAQESEALLNKEKEEKAGPILRRLAERSREWVKATDDAYKLAIESVNKSPLKLPVIQQATTTLPAEASTRALFVPVPFEAENGYAADKTFLWKLGQKAPKVIMQCADKKILDRLLVNDNMQGERPCMCDQAGRTDDLVCVRAGAFHPNEQGAEAYYNAIKNRLEPILPFTGWLPVK